MGFLAAMLLVLLILFPTITFSNPELRALIKMKAALDPGGHVLSSWTENGEPCSGGFEGVVCNRHGKVASISLQGKGLSGFIPPAIGELRCLSGLYLHYNALTGVIPKETANLTDLSELYLDVNGLSGSIPEEIGNMESLQVLQLCCNQLTGSIPTQLGLAKKLTVVALQSNYLTGAIPASLGDLLLLTRLDLGFNRLFGSIPMKLAQLPQLEVLDVRNNNLSGDVPSDLKQLKQFQYANNTDLCGVGFTSLSVCTSADLRNPNRPEPYGPTNISQSVDADLHCSQTHCSKPAKSNSAAIIAAVAAVVFVGILCGLFTFSWYRRHKHKIDKASEVSDSRLNSDHHKNFNRSASPLISLEYSRGWDPLADGRNGNGFYQDVSQSFRFNLDEVEYATQYFSELNLLGKSNFAITYKGILRDGSRVAVKSISKTSCKSEEAEFLKGLKILTLLRHENLVRLRGFCCSRGRGECFLVYDHIGNGNLSLYLDLKAEDYKILEWPTRMSIIQGIAKAIEYLHSSMGNKPSLVHQNISADKILIDHNFKPLLSGSGLHKLLAGDVVYSTHKTSAAMGYLAPEYTTVGRFSEKSDVYAFGVIMLQILTGKKLISHIRLDPRSDKLEDMIDENLNGNFSKQEAAKLTGIVVRCTSEIPSQRPSMEKIVRELSNCC